MSDTDRSSTSAQPPAATARNPWDVIAHGLRSPGCARSAAEQLLIARALAFLGLGWPAGVWGIAARDASAHGSPERSGAESLLEILSANPQSGVVPTPELADIIARVRAVVEHTPRLRDAVEQADPAAFERWSVRRLGASSAGATLLRARDDAWLRLAIDSNPRETASQHQQVAAAMLATADGRRAWAPLLLPASRQAAAVSLPAAPVHAGCTPPDPVLVLGLASTALLERLRDSSPAHALGAVGTLHVVEPDMEQVFDALAVSMPAKSEALSEGAIRDLAWLADDRFVWSVGPNARAHAARYWGERLGLWAALSAVPEPAQTPDTRADAVAWCTATRSALLGRQSADMHRLTARSAQLDRDRDDAWWRARLGRLHTGQEAPRVLVLTSRFSTYVQHAAHDLYRAFATLGGTCELLLEPDNGSSVLALAIARAIERVDPDVIVTINYPRSAMPAVIPRSIPVVAWVQDAMPHLFSRAVARDLGPRDAVVGLIFNELVTDHALPATRCLRTPVLASKAKFAQASRVLVRDAGPDFSCDILIASNHGETPRATAERLEREVVASGGPAGLTERIAERLWIAADTWTHGYSAHLLRAVVRGAIADLGRTPIDAEVRELAQKIATPLLQRWMRHRLVAIAADVCTRRGWTLALHGRGWDRVPEFAQFARGPLGHDDMPSAYAGARVTLHTSPDWPIHQRVFECLLSGGLPAVCLKPEDAGFVLSTARRGLEELCEGEARSILVAPGRPAGAPGRGADGGVHAIDHPGAARALGLAQRLLATLGRGPHADAIPAERPLVDGRFNAASTATQTTSGVARARGIADLAPPWALLDLLDAIEPATFATGAQLERVVERAREDDAWREATIAHARAITERWFTYERAAGGVLSFLADLVGARAAAVSGPDALEPKPDGARGANRASSSPTVSVHAA